MPKYWTLPGYRYMGPGNPLNNGVPKNHADAMSRLHDYAYSRLGKKAYYRWSVADERYLRNIRKDSDWGSYIARAYFRIKKFATKWAGTLPSTGTDPPPYGHYYLKARMPKRKRINNSDSGYWSSRKRIKGRRKWKASDTSVRRVLFPTRTAPSRIVASQGRLATNKKENKKTRYSKKKANRIRRRMGKNPKWLKTKEKYHFTSKRPFGLTSTFNGGFAAVSHSICINNVTNHGEIGGTAYQPDGWDQINDFYQYWTVIGAKATLSFDMRNCDFMQLYMYLSDEETAITDLQTLQDGVAKRLISHHILEGGVGHSSTTNLSLRYSPKLMMPHVKNILRTDLNDGTGNTGAFSLHARSTKGGLTELDPVKKHYMHIVLVPVLPTVANNYYTTNDAACIWGQLYISQVVLGHEEILYRTDEQTTLLDGVFAPQTSAATGP